MKVTRYDETIANSISQRISCEKWHRGFSPHEEEIRIRMLSLSAGGLLHVLEKDYELF